MDKIKLAADKFLSGQGTLEKIKKELEISDTDSIVNEINSRGYYMKAGLSHSSVINIKLAMDEYISNYNNKPSLSKICKKYHVGCLTISNKLKSLGYEIINHQNKIKFNENVFDSIDTEEKAYWLGFIFADGYISKLDDKNHDYYFEISLKGSDKPHLDKFNKFMEHEDPNHVKTNKAECFNTGVITERCRWGIRSQHLWEILNSYGCVPSKSLILKFPKLDIFKNKTLIKHFIRGYWDGDGCLSWGNKEHTNADMSVLGTEDFLIELQKNLPLKQKKYALYNNNSAISNITKVFQIHGKNAFELAYYLYNDAAIYLDRKYEKYKEYCRIYEELYILLQVKNGKVIIDNPVLNSETKKSESMLSIEIEPEKSE